MQRRKQRSESEQPSPEHPPLERKAAAWDILYEPLVAARARRLAAEQQAQEPARQPEGVQVA